MKRISVWPVLAVLAVLFFAGSCYMMWLSGHVNPMWELPSLFTFFASFVLFIMTTMTRNEKTIIKLNRHVRLRERKRIASKKKRNT